MTIFLQIMRVPIDGFDDFTACEAKILPTDGADLLVCMLLLFMGARHRCTQLSYSFLHLANNPQDRRKITNDPSRSPTRGRRAHPCLSDRATDPCGGR